MLPPDRARELMERCCALAMQSVSEGGPKPRPKVGALVCDANGKVLLEAFRGEIERSHAEAVLLSKAKKAQLQLKGTFLFTTLEPCTERGPGKVPCAERVALEDFAAVYIGTLDPNPDITGKGEMCLCMAESLEVRRFDYDLGLKLRTEIDPEFFESYRDYYASNGYRQGGSRFSLYTHADLAMKRLVAHAAGKDDRNKLLLQTADLISGANTEVFVIGGDLSWWREAYVCLLEAAVRNVRLRVAAPPLVREVEDAVLSLGAELRVVNERPPLVATVCDPGSTDQAIIVKDRGAATLLTTPEDRGLQRLLLEKFESIWEAAAKVAGPSPVQIRAGDVKNLCERIRGSVPAYKDATFSFESVPVLGTVPLTPILESFKLFRLRKLESVRANKPALFPAGSIGNCKWIVAPPIVEVLPDGRSVVIDGTHRFAVARDLNHLAIDAIVVRGCTAPLPATPLESWSNMKIVRTMLDRESRYRDYKPEHFRRFNAAFERLDRG